MKTHVEPMGHNIKLFSAACLQIEPSLHSSFCFIVCFILPAIDRIHPRYFLQMQFLETAKMQRKPKQSEASSLEEMEPPS